MREAASGYAPSVRQTHQFIRKGYRGPQVAVGSSQIDHAPVQSFNAGGLLSWFLELP